MHCLKALIETKDGVYASAKWTNSEGFGAEIAGVDLARPLDASLAVKLPELLAEYQLLVFRSQEISLENQCTFTRCFGEPERSIEGRSATHQVPGYPNVLRLHNRPGSKTINYGQKWHSDGLAYARIPHGATVLHCEACPEGAGDTLFASQVLAHASMPASLRKKISNLLWLLPPMPFSEVPHGKELAQPLVRQHPLTGKQFIFCSPNAQRILGLPREKGEEILEVVHRYQIAEQYTYRHCWRPGDLVVWENCALLHNRAGSVDYFKQGLREMHRTATAGTFSATELELPA